jgi:polysaccharide biosynthesis/export protein
MRNFAVTPAPLIAKLLRSAALSASALALLAGCASTAGLDSLPSAQFVSPNEGPGAEYIIGPLDGLNIFVFRNPELSTNATVRPDGRITLPLIEDIPATGQTPAQLARAIEDKLKTFIQNPIVSVVVNGFNGPFAQQVRVVGEASEPRAIPYRANMTLLDVMIAVGGTTEFAAGNRARLVRFDKSNGTQREFILKIDRLIKDGDTRANVRIEPGDVIIIPESFF